MLQKSFYVLQVFHHPNLDGSLNNVTNFLIKLPGFYYDLIFIISNKNEMLIVNIYKNKHKPFAVDIIVLVEYIVCLY